MFGFLNGYFSNDLAIDLGTANTLIYVRGKGIVLNEPSVVAIRQEGGPNGKKVIQEVGLAAKQMLGRTPGNITAIRPMKDGVIADFTVTEQMLKMFIKRVHDSRLFSPSPRIVICVPCGSTQVERRAIREAAFAFRAEMFSRSLATAFRQALQDSVPQGTRVDDLQETEDVHPEAHGVELYAPVHDYIYRASGRVAGSFPGVVEIQRRLAEMEFVQVERLHLEGNQPEIIR